MVESRSLQWKIDAIGKEMVRCDEGCDRVVCEPAGGMPPRCLVLDDGEIHQIGCVIVGVNPGSAKRAEREALGRSQCKYVGYVEYWRKNLACGHTYYTRLREFVRDNEALGLKGPILWTELVKCQSAESQDQNGKTRKMPLPVNTIRTCVRRYLSMELKAVPDEWPIIAVGRAVFNIVPYLSPTRAVLGIPHASGAWGEQFAKAAHGDAARMRNALRERTAVWLGEMGGGE